MKRTRFIAVVLLCVLSFSSISALTSAPESVSPYWTNIRSVNCLLGIGDKTADCFGQVVGEFGTTRIIATLTLYRQNGSTWIPVKYWDRSASSSSLTISEEHTITSGTYKLVLFTTVYRNSTSESTSKESTVVVCT